MESAMLSYLTSLGIWNWFIAAVLLIVLEMIAPGAFMLWLGLAALAVGLISLLISWGWQAQCVTFVVFAAALFPLWRRFQPVTKPPSDSPLLNQRTQTYVGQVFTLDKPIVDGTGTIRIGDTTWRVSGADCAAGRKVRVARADGPMLFVEPV
jgi:membrane protein implicated in regulation of membrane protease activity